MSRQARFEVVRTDAGWHGRFRAANGRVVWTTEVYTRRRAVLRAVEVIAGPITYYPNECPEVDDPTEAFWGRDVRILDERGQA